MTFVIRLSSFIILALASCVPLESPAQRQARANRLQSDLLTLRPDVSPREAALLATTAVERAAELQRQWRPMKYGWANNCLIHARLRPKGLCYEWRDSTYPPLHLLHLHTLDIHLASARRATRREHNALVITARGQPFEQGIVLDGWRHGGILEWARLKDDHYPWKPLPWALTPMELRQYIMPELYPNGVPQ
jgi:hypothetical protein